MSASLLDFASFPGAPADKFKLAKLASPDDQFNPSPALSPPPSPSSPPPPPATAAPPASVETKAPSPTPPQPPTLRTIYFRIVLPDGTDAASRVKVLDNVVTTLVNKGFAVDVSPATDVFILTAESPLIEKLLRPTNPFRIKGVTVIFREQDTPAASAKASLYQEKGGVGGEEGRKPTPAAEAQALSPPPPPPACANPRRDASADEDPRPEVVHIHGFDTRMKAEDLLSLFTAKGLAPPRTVAWVNDSSANVVFSDASAARAALEQQTVPLLPNAQDIDTTSWRTLPIELAAAGKGLQLLFRLATASDFQPKQQDKPCKPWQKGRCLYGSACKFAHDARKPPPLQKQRSASGSPICVSASCSPTWSPRSASPRSASPSSASPSLASPSSESPRSESPRSASPASGAQPGADRPRPTMSPALLAAAARVGQGQIVRQGIADEPPQLEKITSPPQQAPTATPAPPTPPAPPAPPASVHEVLAGTAAGAYRVTLHKPDTSARLGITLVNNEERARGPPAPIITALAPGCLAADSGRITINQLLVAVNGQRVHTHKEATALLRNAVGDVELTLTASGAGSGGRVPPVTGGAVVDDVLDAVAASTAQAATAGSASGSRDVLPYAACSRKAFVVLPKLSEPSDPSAHARVETALSRHFGRFGTVVSCTVRVERGCGFVEWTTPEAAARAIAVPRHFIDELRHPSGSYSFDVLVVPYSQQKGVAPAAHASASPIRPGMMPPLPQGMPKPPIWWSMPPPIWPGMPPPIWPGMPPPIWPGVPGRGGIPPIWPGKCSRHLWIS